MTASIETDAKDQKPDINDWDLGANLDHLVDVEDGIRAKGTEDSEEERLS